jgi:calcineurin-like phosphoesterase family protein
MSQKKFYISDLHFGHINVLKFDNRPWDYIDDMEKDIISNWNNVVRNGDDVYVLGDFIWSAKDEDWIEILNQLNGNIHLIRGNHDKRNMSPQLKKKFASISDYKEIRDNERLVILSHYPILAYKHSYDPNVYMLHGHTHKTKEQKYIEKWVKELKENKVESYDNCGNIINVGCMMNYINFIPRTLDELIKNN